MCGKTLTETKDEVRGKHARDGSMGHGLPKRALQFKSCVCVFSAVTATSVRFDGTGLLNGSTVLHF